MHCSICEKRKEKRFCPAVHASICPQCCGEQREITLECPADCVHLRQAREHEKPRPLKDLDQSALFPRVEVSDRFLYDQEHLVLGLTFALARSARGSKEMRDRDLIAVLTGLARSYETLASSGLHYEIPSTNLAHQKISSEIQQMIKEYRDAEHKHLGYTRLRDSDVLLALVFLVRLAVARTSGRPRSRAFIDFLFGQFPEQTAAVATARDGSRIIVP